MTVTANPVSREQARKVASAFGKTIGLQISETASPDKSSTRYAEMFDNLYIFTGNDGKGFVIVSADDCTIPILGYSGRNTFVGDTLPDALLSWLEGYEAEIGLCRQQSNSRDHRQEAAWQRWLGETELETDTNPNKAKELATENIGEVAPMIQTRWNQTTYYNAYCPWHTVRRYCPINYHDSDTVYKTITASVGCVATAMAQVMKYWNWPEHGRGSHSYTYYYPEILIYENSAGNVTWTYDGVYYEDTLTANFADTTFRWDEMPNRLTDSNDAVASLMITIGISIQMNYLISQLGGSSSYLYPGNSMKNHTVEEALRNYFHYSHNVTSVEQKDFTDEEWKAMLRDELDAGRPVLYRGSNHNGGGHTFVCDGYRPDGYFHFNWGWSGSADGYYAIGALNPSGRYYNVYGAAVIGIEPATTCYPETGSTTILTTANNALYGATMGSGTYNNWTDTVTLTATPNEGYGFLQWNDGCRFNPRHFIASGGHQTYTAIFGPYQGEEISYCGTIYHDFFPIEASAQTPEWGIRIPTTRIGTNNSIDGIVFTGYYGSYTIKIYSGGTTGPDSCLYTSAPINMPYVNKYFHRIEPAVAIPAGQPIWITLSSADGGRCTTIENMSNTDGRWDKYDGTWTNNSSPSENGRPYLIAAHFKTTTFEPVSGLAVTNVTAHGATLNWNAPNSDTPSSYTVAWGIGATAEQVAQVNTTDTAHSLTSLAENTEYHVWVRANYNNDQDQSLWKECSFVATGLSNPVNIEGLANNTEMGFVEGGGLHEQGSTVTLQAIAKVGHTFVKWEDNNSSNATRQIVASQDSTFTAVFQANCYEFTATSDNEDLGTVSIEGDATGESCYPYLSTVILSAEANPGADFVQWSDGNTTNPRYCTIMESNPTLIAHFEPQGIVKLYSKGHDVSVGAVEPQSIVVYDIMGRKVYESPLPLTFTTFTLPSAGVYIVRIGGIYSEKIIVR